MADLSQVYPQGYNVRTTAVRGDVVRDESERIAAMLGPSIRAYRFMNQRYEETMTIVTRAGYKFDADMDTSLWETKHHMVERIPQDGAV